MFGLKATQYHYKHKEMSQDSRVCILSVRNVHFRCCRDDGDSACMAQYIVLLGAYTFGMKYTLLL